MPGTLIHVHALDDPRLAPFANLKDRDIERLRLAPGAAGEGLFVCESELTVRRLVESRFAVHSMLMTPAKAQDLADVIARVPEVVPVYLAPPDVMDRVVGFHIHRGVLACAHRRALASTGDLLDADVVVIAESLANHDNVGGMFRTVAGLCGGRAAVLMDRKTCDPLYRKSVRVSVGNVLHVPFAVEPDWPGGLEALRRAGFRLIALTPGEGSVDLREVSPPSRLGLMVGAEGPGLSEEALAQADVRVRIPMAGGVDSLNVVVALGIALHHLMPR